MLAMKLNKQNTKDLTSTIDAYGQRYYMLAVFFDNQIKFVLETDMAPLLVHGVALQVGVFVPREH
jgi:hypothetical protein